MLGDNSGTVTLINICIGLAPSIFAASNILCEIELNELTLLGMDRVSAYIALLFLTAETDYDLKQDEFYSDLYVVKGGEDNEHGTVKIAN